MYRKIKLCTHAKFQKYAQNIGWAFVLSTLLILRKSAVFYSCTLATRTVNNTDYKSDYKSPDSSAAGTSGMPQGLSTGPAARQAPLMGPSEGCPGWRRFGGSKCAPWVGRPPAERAGPCFRPRRPTRAERAAAANFHESVSAVLYTPIHLNWV